MSAAAGGARGAAAARAKRACRPVVPASPSMKTVGSAARAWQRGARGRLRVPLGGAREQSSRGAAPLRTRARRRARGCCTAASTHLQRRSGGAAAAAGGAGALRRVQRRGALHRQRAELRHGVRAAVRDAAAGAHGEASARPAASGSAGGPSCGRPRDEAAPPAQPPHVATAASCLPYGATGRAPGTQQGQLLARATRRCARDCWWPVSSNGLLGRVAAGRRRAPSQRLGRCAARARAAQRSARRHGGKLNACGARAARNATQPTGCSPGGRRRRRKE